MKKLLFLCVLVMGGFITSDANACCCEYEPSCEQYDPCCPQFDSCCENDFGGIYLGGNLGVFSHTAHRHDLDGFLTDNSGWTTIDTNVTLGVQLGYDWKCGDKLLGVVVDWNWANAERDIRFPNTDADQLIRNEFSWFSTFRLRAGVTVCDALLYVTGGAAAARFDTRWRDLTAGDFHNREVRWGWVGGVGTEFLLSCNFSVGAEFLYLQFADSKRTFLVNDETPTLFTFGHDDSAWIGRVTVNYRFEDLLPF
jgi:opacity protein-like surface antigen